MPVDGLIVTTGAYTPPIEPELKAQMPWLRDSFSGTSSTVECLRDLGGPACYSRLLPPGLALKQYSQDEARRLRLQVEDVRAQGSPPLSSMIEFATFHVTEPNRSKPPLKPSTVAQFSFGGDSKPYTYALKYNTPMYNFGTFYTPVKMHLSSLNVHTHSIDGDEFWAVRGTQDDLGIAPEVQSPPYWKTSGLDASFVHSEAKELSHGDSLSSLKVKFEESMHVAGNQWEKERGVSSGSGGKASRSWPVSEPARMEYFIPFNVDSPFTGVGKPEILCKWYGAVEHLTASDVAEQQRQFQQLFKTGGHQVIRGEMPASRRSRVLLGSDSYLGRSNASAALRHRGLLAGETTLHGGPDGNKSRGSSTLRSARIGTMNTDPIGSDGYVIQDTNTDPLGCDMVPPVQQYHNFYSGVLPGDYYRHPTNARINREAKYNKCNSFTLEAGDYLTIVAFNEPRVNPTLDDNEAFLQPIKAQHSRLTGQAYMPDVPWFY